ncbi:MAG: lysylphosphatidylglycerol synthase domain-containing protein [Ramlibacter sp.]
MSAAVPQALPQRLRERPWWPWAMRGLAALFVGFIGWMLYQYARDIEWSRVDDAVRALPAPVLALAAALAACSHLLYSTFDLLGRHYTGHKLSAPMVMGVTFTSYAFNLNLGSIVGGVGLRFRLYSRLGLRGGAITRVLSMSLLTNWLGFLVLAGAVFALFPLPLPAQWQIGNGALRITGLVLLAAAMAWGALVTLSPRREFTVLGKRLPLPGPRMTLLQLAMSCANWMLIAGIIWVLLQGQVAYTTVLAVYLLAAIAGVVTYIPAGLGVLEAVFVMLLGKQLGEPELLGALLAYRAVYYLGPLLAAAVMYAVMETRARRA